ncbi:MAG TPA: PBSX family phage terminase large subunit, partial [Desulfosporosinus sp.]|nr:PBSX family phage terminase large subunit [Desulfosporosinus sp.]
MELKAKFPEKLQFLFWPRRYKVARGGRAGSKSWGFGRALLIQGIEEQLRILCTREVQLSIKDSVHKLLKDQINMMDMGGNYKVFENNIRGINGSEFTFTGLSQHTAHTLKSFEGYDRCWVEEGQAVSKRSWDILIPTIRKAGSEIWISYNPDLETDITHQRFTINPPPDCTNVEINWRDNPWFNDVMEKERLHCQKTDPDNYDNIWEGKCKSAVEGAIYFKEIQAAEAQGRICNAPYDPMLKVHIVMDLGWEDSLTAALVQRHVSETRFIEYIEVHHTSLDVLSSQLKTRPYNWGRVWLPAADGFSGSLKSNGKSVYDIMRALGWDVAEKEEVAGISVDDGIRETRMKFPMMYFDKTKCHAFTSPDITYPMEGFSPTDLNWRLIECLKR